MLTEIILVTSIIIGFLYKSIKYDFAIIAALICDMCIWHNSPENSDVFCYIFREVLLCSYLALSYTHKGFKFEENVLFILSLVGGLVSISCNNLFTLFLGLELNALPLYIAAYRNKSTQQPQYVMFGMVASAIEFFGISAIYYSTGTLNMHDISQVIFMYSSNMRSLGIFIFIIGFFIKLGVIPFHNWLLEISDRKKHEAYFPVVIIISKIFAIVALMRCLHFAFSGINYKFFMTLFSILSLLLSSFCALRAHDLRKLIAYISIEHISLMIGGMSCFSQTYFLGVFLFIICEILSLIGLFSIITNIRYNTFHEIRTIRDLRGLGKDEPALSFSLSCLLISLAGVPPFIGFWGKYYILLSLSDFQNYTMFTACLISILISGIYTANILKNIWTASNRKFKISGRVYIIHFLTFLSLFLCLFNGKINLLINGVSI